MPGPEGGRIRPSLHIRQFAHRQCLDMPVDGVPSGAEISGGERSALVEVQEALGGLGYTLEEVRSVLGDLAGDDAAVLLREALQRLARA